MDHKRKRPAGTTQLALLAVEQTLTEQLAVVQKALDDEADFRNDFDDDERGTLDFNIADEAVYKLARARTALRTALEELDGAEHIYYTVYLAEKQSRRKEETA